jgi:4-amino-4-deoxy-L-arabinose transferase-like glycosyltransferase
LKSDTRISLGLIRIIVALILVVLSLAVLANSMTKPVGRDEQMYCTGAVCLAQAKMIYRDFAYAAQMPYHPLLCAALFRLFDTTYYLLVVRLLSCVCDILVMVCIVGIYRHVFKPSAMAGVLFGLAAAVLYVFNPLVDYANGYAWNHDVVILCVMLSFWLFVSTDFQQESRYWRIAALGALLTFATCMRITTALAELLFFAILLSQPAKSIKQRLQTALPFLTASALVLIWPVWLVAQAPRAFFLNLVKIPALYGQWLHEIGMVYNKLGLTFACLTEPGYFVLILLTIYLWASVLFLRGRLKIENGRTLLLAALLPVIFFVVALLPPTMWQQYLAVPVPFIVVSLAFPLWYLGKLAGKARTVRHSRITVIPTALCTLVAVLSYPAVLYRTPFALVPEKWAPMEMHKVSQDIVAKTKEPKRILTFAPLLALEGGGEIYNELSAGAIIYRIADSLSPDERRITHTAGPKSLLELLEKNPPSAVILGVEMQRLEQPILESVVKANWQRVNYEDGPTVYFRP